MSVSYIVVKGKTTIEGDHDAKTRNKKVIRKNNAPFWLYIAKISNTFIDNAEDLDIVIPMNNLLEYSDNYSMKSGSLWNYHRDGMKYGANENDNANNKINNEKTITSRYFEYKTKIRRRTTDNNKTLDTEDFVPLKYLINFWRFLDLPLTNCKTELDLSRSKNCMISEISITPRVAGNPNANPPVLAMATIQAASATFQTNNATFYVPVVTLSINDNIIFLENIKQKFKRTIS